MDDFPLELEDSKLHPNIQCTPTPGKNPSEKHRDYKSSIRFTVLVISVCFLKSTTAWKILDNPANITAMAADEYKHKIGSSR